MKHSITKALLIATAIFALSFSTYAKKNTCSLSVTVIGRVPMTCNGGNTGMLIASVSGGTAPYTYTWSPSGGTGDTASNLVAGSYTVYVKDFVGCSDSAVFNINTDYVTAILTNDTVCGGSCNGTLTPTILVGTFPFSCNWSNGSFSVTATNLCAGTYTVTLADANGCIATAAGTVVTPSNIPSLVVTPTITNSSCPYNLDGSIVLNATAPTSPFRYEWGSTYGSNGLYNIYAGSYNVIIWDSKNNCNALSYNVNSTAANCGIIYGTTYNDTNFTCIYSSKDPDLNCSYLTINPGGYNVYPDMHGYYSSNIYFPYGSYTVTQTINTGSPFGACSSTLPLTVSSSTPSTDFLDTTHAKLSDPEITYLFESLPIPGEPFSAQFQIKNIGNDSSYGRAFITIPDSMLFVSTIPAYSLQIHDTVYWNYSGLMPGDTLDYTINCIADSLSSVFEVVSWVDAGVLPSNPESNTANDVRGIGFGWVDAVDPNYKSVSPPGTGPQGYISLADSVLTYIIHFQNTGTAAARNVYVLDTIDTHLDINTLDVLGSSNTYSYQVKGNVVKFIFSNINLPDSSTTPSGSQAWIQYTVKQKSGNKNGDVIHNTGYVYFDYNAPVVTNTTTNTIQVPLGILPAHLSNPGLSLYPNPASDNVQLSYTLDKVSSTTIQIIDLLGSVVYQENKGQQQAGVISENISTSELATGTYMVKLTTNNVTSIRKLVIIR
jgi:hypothetical protein